MAATTVVLGYLLAGLVVGPHLPVPLVADPKIVGTSPSSASSC
ncbi:MAG: hypothetical protein R2939_08790 [Kofleriaceae bacterium]